jgi:peptidoglycan/LPS O-acetylase OafA/YrhL
VYLSIQGGWVLSYIEHFWSLAVEEHFYFVWPLAIWLLRSSPRLIMGMALAVVALVFGGQVAASLAGVNPIVTLVLTPFQLDALCLGGFLAVYVRQPGGEAAVKRLIVPMALVGGAVLLLQFGLNRFNLEVPVIRSLRAPMLRLLLASLLLQALAAPASSVMSRFFRSGPMVALGKYSYGLYVYHHFLSYYFAKHGTEFVLARVVGSHTLAVAIQALGGMTVSMVVAWLSYEFFEKYFLQLKRFWPSSRDPATVAAVAK